MGRPRSLDVVGVSAWFPLVETRPSSVTSVDTLQQAYERVFREHLAPLAAYNAGRPVVFAEYGVMDTVESPAAPDAAPVVTDFMFSDMNGNGIDDGRETQANAFEALFRTMDRYPDVVHGAFFWDNWIASDEDWERYWTGRRNYDVRNKPSGDVVRARYRRLANRPPVPVGTLPGRRLATPGGVLDVDDSPAFVDPDGDALTYAATSSARQVATTRTAGGQVTLTAVNAGVATIRVTATDAGSGGSRRENPGRPFSGPAPLRRPAAGVSGRAMPPRAAPAAVFATLQPREPARCVLHRRFRISTEVVFPGRSSPRNSSCKAIRVGFTGNPCPPPIRGSRRRAPG